MPKFKLLCSYKKYYTTVVEAPTSGAAEEFASWVEADLLTEVEGADVWDWDVIDEGKIKRMDPVGFVLDEEGAVIEDD